MQVRFDARVRQAGPVVEPIRVAEVERLQPQREGLRVAELPGHEVLDRREVGECEVVDVERLGALGKHDFDVSTVDGPHQPLPSGKGAHLIKRLQQEPSSLMYFYGSAVTPEFGPTTDKSKVSDAARLRSEEHTSELQSLMRISYAVF